MSTKRLSPKEIQEREEAKLWGNDSPRAKAWRKHQLEKFGINFPNFINKLAQYQHQVDQLNNIAQKIHNDSVGLHDLYTNLEARLRQLEMVRILEKPSRKSCRKSWIQKLFCRYVD